MGNSLSQPYELEWEFFVDMDPTDYKVRTRDHEGGWKGHSPIDEPNVGTVTVDYLKKDEYTDASFNKAKIRGVKAEILEYFSSTNASGTNFVSIPYSSIASSRVAVNQNNGQVIVTFNADTIRAAYQNAGLWLQIL